MNEAYAEVDISEQIDNKWSKDTVLAIRFKGTSYSIKIKNKSKNDLKSKFIKEVKDKKDKKNRRYNRQVIVITYCFLLYHLLKISNKLSKEVSICNDVSPTWAVIKYLDAICKRNKEQLMTQKFKLSFKRKKDGKSKAHYIAKDVSKGRMPATITFKKQHMDELKNILKEFL